MTHVKCPGLSSDLLYIEAFVLCNCSKLRTMVTNRALRFLQECAQKKPDDFRAFYRDYGIFLKEGIISEAEQVQKVNYSEGEICPCLRRVYLIV